MSAPVANSPAVSMQHLSPAWTHMTRDPIVRGEGVYLHADSGKRYLDFTSGIGVTNTGHCHPRVVAAIQQQAEHLIFGQINCVVGERAIELSETLSSVTPDTIDTFFFSNSGSEAVEGSIKLARMATGRTNIISFSGGFHGRTSLAMALTASKTVYRAGYQPLPSGIFFAPFPYAFQYGWDEDQAVDFCERQLHHLLASQTAPSETAAMILEPVLGEGGYVPAPPRFLEVVREVCDMHGILMIADEIQSGCARTGKWWAHQHSCIKPDIMIIAKGIASGMPFSAIGASRELMSKWPAGSHGGTYGGGNAIVLAAANETVKVIAEEKLSDNAAVMGNHLVNGLKQLQTSNDAIHDVRGAGLMVACEFEPSPEGKRITGTIITQCAEDGLLLLPCGTAGNVVRWIPPLIVNQQQIGEGLEIFEKAMQQALQSA